MDRAAGRSPREDATEASVEGVTVPKTGQKNALPREDATEASVEGVPVPKQVVGGAWVVFQTETTLVRAGWLGESKGDGCSRRHIPEATQKRKRLAKQS